MSHLKNKHPKQHQEVLKMNTDVRTADSQKRLLEEEADEMENTQKAHLRTEAEREEFLQEGEKLLQRSEIWIQLEACQHKQPLVIFLHLSRDPDVILNQNIWSSGID